MGRGLDLSPADEFAGAIGQAEQFGGAESGIGDAPECGPRHLQLSQWTR
jgi:hypothetical protein